MSTSDLIDTANAPISVVRIRPYTYRMPRVVRTATGVCIDRTGWHVIVHSADGFVGIGDVAPWPGFGSDAQSCAAALRTLERDVSADGWLEGRARARVLGALPVEVACGLDQALLDIQAQRAGLPLCAQLAGAAAPVDTVGVHALVDNALEAQAAVAQGYNAIKVKVGIEAVSDEVTRIVALRAAVGPDIALRLDANGAWPVPVALRAARLLAMVSPEWLEQPVAKGDIEGLAYVRRLGGVPIAADESVINMADLDAVMGLQAADVIVLKPMFTGGLRCAFELGQKALGAGLDVCVTHALESSVGRLGALHLALALGCTRPCGLGGALAARQPLMPQVAHGHMQAPADAGLGLDAQVRRELVC